MKKFYVLYFEKPTDTVVSQKEIMAGSMGLALQEFEVSYPFDAVICYPEDLKLTFTPQTIPYSLQKNITND